MKAFQILVVAVVALTFLLIFYLNFLPLFFPQEDDIKLIGKGLDIAETSMVIFYEPTPSAVRKIQRAGRTARTMPGKVLILITKDTRDEAYYWVGHHKERKMNKILRGMQGQKTLTNL